MSPPKHAPEKGGVRPFFAARRAGAEKDGESSRGMENPVSDASKVPDFRGMTLRAVLEESAAAGLPVEVLGRGLARDQNPPPGAVLPAGGRVRVQFAR